MSEIDGVPILIKDRFPVGDYITRKGVSCHKLPQKDDFLVKQARDAGLVFVGISNMTQCMVGKWEIAEQLPDSRI